MTTNPNDADPLATIDLGMIDGLQALRKEADVLRDRLTALAKMKDELEEAVYKRVNADYGEQLRKLEARSGPLRKEARQTWAGLRDAVKRIDNAHQAVLLDQQENNLRHKLGEFDDEEYARRAKDIEATLRQSGRAHEKAAKLRARFLEVFDNEAELDAPLASDPATNPAVLPSKTQEMEPAEIDDPAPSPPPAPSTAAPSSRSVASTQILSALNLPQPPRAPAVPAAPEHGYSDAVTLGDPQATAFFRTARLVPQSPEAGRKAIPLAPKAVILGADTTADIRIGGPSVNPHHARIEPHAQGYVLIDLGSDYGTRVNADSVTKCTLHHEDVIQIGAARFVFRED